MTFTTYDFDGGTDNANVATGGGVETIGGTPKYETAAAVHGSLGVEMIGAGQFLRYLNPLPGSGSIYSRATTAATGSNRILIWGTSANGTNLALRYHDSGTFSITNTAGTQVGATTTMTWTAGDVFRFDWQFSEAGTTATVTVRFFKNANIEGTIADEEITRSDTTGGTPSTRLRIGSSTAGWTTRLDTLRLSSSLEWAPPFAPPAGTTFDLWNGTSWETLSPEFWNGTSWEPLTVEYEPAGSMTTYDYEEGSDGAAVPAGSFGVVEVNNGPLYEANARHHGSMGVRCTDTANYIYNAGGLEHSFSVYTRQVAMTETGSDRSITYMSASNATIVGFRFSSTNHMGIIDATGTLMGEQSGTQWELDQWFRIDGKLERSVAGPDYTYTFSARIFRKDPDGRVPDETLVRTFSSPYTLGRFRLGSTRIGCAADFDTLRFRDEARWFEPHLSDPLFDRT